MGRESQFESSGYYHRLCIGRFQCKGNQNRKGIVSECHTAGAAFQDVLLDRYADERFVEEILDAKENPRPLQISIFHRHDIHA